MSELCWSYPKTLDFTQELLHLTPWLKHQTQSIKFGTTVGRSDSVSRFVKWARVVALAVTGGWGWWRLTIHPPCCKQTGCAALASEAAKLTSKRLISQLICGTYLQIWNAGVAVPIRCYDTSFIQYRRCSFLTWNITVVVVEKGIKALQSCLHCKEKNEIFA